MTQWLQRNSWRARRPRGRGRRFGSSRPDGIVLHWPGTPRPIRPERVAEALRSWQDYHMRDRGWRDIAYNHAVDQLGRVWALRGVHLESAANGSSDANARFAAVLLIVAEGEEPSPAMVAATRDLLAYLRRVHPSATLLRGHGDVRPTPTDCPGDAVRRLMKRGILA